MQGDAKSTRNCVDFGIAALIAIFAALSVPLLFTSTNGIYSVDEYRWHVPAIKLIYEHWPRLDVRNDSLSAVAPGYHYALATIAQITGLELRNLRLINWILSLLMIPVLYWHVGRYCSHLTRFLIVAPFVTSSFFVKSAAWILTDNASLLFVTIGLIALIFFQTSTATAGVVAISSASATFFRQISLWLAGPTLISGVTDIFGSHIQTTDSNLHTERRGWLMIMACLAPTAVMSWLFYEWGGLVPPIWRSAAYGGWSFCPIAYVLSLTAVLGVPYCLYLRVNPLRDVPNSLLLLCLLCGVVLSLLSPTNYQPSAAGGYLWDIVVRTPRVFERSVVFIVLAPLGLIVVCSLACCAWRKLGYRIAILWSTSWLAWCATFFVNRQMFQRYMEPTIVVFLVLLAAPLYKHTSSPSKPGLIQRSSLSLLVLLQVAITMMTWYRTFR